MTDHDIQLLAIGASIGMYLMLLVQITFGILDNRRDRQAVRAVEARLAAAQRNASPDALPDFVDTYADPAIIGKAGRP
ncbi:hypothetical protein ABZU94_29850 [Streptomyces mirabilis]|uniref:hypothetical protein n=1 Tax=Streptomyces sp. NPDC005388 TaxID=3156717 RepID=UPI0033B5A976